MTSFYAKRIIGDSASNGIADGLLQVNVSSTKLVTRSHNNNSAYYIAYVDDTTAGIDIIEFQNINLELTNTAGDTLTFSTSTIESSGELSVNTTSTSAVVFGGNIHTNGAITIGNLQGLNLILDNHSIFAREWDSTNEEYIDSALSLGGDTSIDGYLNVVGDFYSGGDIYLAEAKSIFMNYTVPGEEGEEGTPTDFPILVNNDDGTVSLNSLTGALYLGYLNTEEIHIYTSDDTDRYDWIEINADGPYATTNLGVGGQDPDYVFYVNGTSYFSDNITSTKTIWFGNNTSTGKAILGYNSTYPNYGIWYFEDTNDIMTLSASGNADDETTADFGINVHGAGTLTNRNNRIPHTGNTTGTVGGGEQPVYVNAGTISNTSYALKATVNNGDANYVAYYSGERALSSSKAATAMIMPAHYYHNLYNNNPTTGTTVYVHYYNSSTTSTNTFANLRVKSGNSYKVLAFGGDGNLTWDGHITANSGYLKSTANGNTVTIGSQNTSCTHIYNSANISFIFNNTVSTTTGNLGTTSYPWNNLYIGTANGAGIYYVGTKNTYRMIRFIDNTADTYGNGISIGGGGLTVIGSGESADTILSNLSLTAAGGSETTYIGSDSSILFYPSINSWDTAAKIEMTAGRIWAGVNANTTRENQIGVQSGSGQIYMYAQAATSAGRGIYIPAHGSGAAKAVVHIDTNNRVYFADSYNGTGTALAYSQTGLAASAITWLTCWNGYELRAISKAEMATATDSAHKWTRIGGDTMTGTLTFSDANIGIARVGRSTSWIAGRTGALVKVTSISGYSGAISIKTKNGAWVIGAYDHSSYQDKLIFSYGSDSNYNSSNNTTTNICFRSGGVTENAMWNDYAEYRKASTIEPGRVVYETHKEMALTNQRLLPGARVISDTYGFIIGHNNDAETPIAVSGRVLVYPYQDKYSYKLGAAVCSAPNGTVDIMTREEIMKYPERIVGTVSEIPDYDKWQAGGGDTEIDVNGRIWIYVR